jgi:acylphosphatase
MADLRQIQRFVVTGRVQGVGFRNFIARHANRLGLSGWVRNRGLNEVEIVAAGEAELLDELAALAQKGPASARVEDVFREPAEESAFASNNQSGNGMVVAASV